MRFSDIDVYQILSLGVIGLGFLLAVMAIRLLLLEQKRDEPRKAILNSAYVYMCFCIVLIVGGLISEYLHNDYDEQIQINTNKSEMTNNREDGKRKRQYQDSTNESKETISTQTSSN